MVKSNEEKKKFFLIESRIKKKKFKKIFTLFNSRIPKFFSLESGNDDNDDDIGKSEMEVGKKKKTFFLRKIRNT